jgi:hypothetical protein
MGNLTVGELIKKLGIFPKDMLVAIADEEMGCLMTFEEVTRVKDFVDDGPRKIEVVVLGGWGPPEGEEG